MHTHANTPSKLTLTRSHAQQQDTSLLFCEFARAVFELFVTCAACQFCWAVASEVSLLSASMANFACAVVSVVVIVANAVHH